MHKENPTASRSVWTPVVNRRWLYLIAGLLWGGVGIMLCSRAAGWLIGEPISREVLLSLIGITAGVAIYRFKFTKLVKRNIKRIEQLDARASIFAFQSAFSYALIAFMMGLGIALRHSAIPKPYLAVLYIGIGLGLLLASGRYYPHVRDVA